MGFIPVLRILKKVKKKRTHSVTSKQNISHKNFLFSSTFLQCKSKPILSISPVFLVAWNLKNDLNYCYNRVITWGEILKRHTCIKEKNREPFSQMACFKKEVNLCFELIQNDHEYANICTKVYQLTSTKTSFFSHWFLPQQFVPIFCYFLNDDATTPHRKIIPLSRTSVYVC